ncbi:MAG: class I SAM-dependent methyltransferase [Desulfobacteraceae bacterium]|jgi:23S rRNA G2069 N7-methylase RlmK/C1962 C5-methylase RlmI|nr:class I SAM-dependent methyltransferase [Desulfobacteraceae bacterium]
MQTLDNTTRERFENQARMIANRVKKRFKHLHRRFSKARIDVFRLYDADIPEIRAVVDWYAGHLVVGEYARRQSVPQWLPLMGAAAAEALQVPADRLHLKTRLSGARDGQRYRRFGRTESRLTVREGDFSFRVNLDDFVDTGLFADHRDTRRLVREAAAGKAFLNLYAYTGTFTCYAARGGAAASVSVDRSETVLDWARENFALNGVSEDAHRLVQADVFAFLKAQKAKARRFDLAVVDPPSYSTTRSRDLAFDILKDHPRLLRSVINVMQPGGTLLFSTNHQGFAPRLADLSVAAMEEITAATVPEDYSGRRRPIHRCWRMTV